MTAEYLAALVEACRDSLGGLPSYAIAAAHAAAARQTRRRIAGDE